MHLLIGLDALDLLAHPVTSLPDSTAELGTRKIHYPAPSFTNLRLFSTPLNSKLFLAGVYVAPTFADLMANNCTKGKFNGFVLPHTQVSQADTRYRPYSHQQLYEANFVVQNVLLPTEDSVVDDENISLPASPPRMDPEWEEELPVAYSPLSPAFSCDDDDEENNDDCNAPLQPPVGEYVEPDSGIDDFEKKSITADSPQCLEEIS